VRNARAISRYRSSARSNGRNNLPRLDESDEAVAFLACTKSTFSVFRIPTQNRRKFPKNEEFLARGSARIVHLADIFAVPNSENTHPRGFVTASLFRVFRFFALDVHSHVDILTRHENGRCTSETDRAKTFGSFASD